MFSQTTEKGFLLTLDTKDNKTKGFLVTLDTKDNKTTKGVELKPTTTHTAQSVTNRIKSMDYSSSQWGHTTVLGSGGTWWECWFKKTKR